jgi:CRISPR-associated endonuclease/helicase Cas3
LGDVTEICPEPVLLAQREQLRRVEAIDGGALSLDELAARLVDAARSQGSALAVVNTKGRMASVLTRAIAIADDLTVIGLSTNLCPADRVERIERIRSAIDRGEPIAVVSTQLIEAGVDLDFAVGFREVAGWDSIVQSAGRVNRNGRRAIASLTVFESGGAHPPGYGAMIAAMRRTVARHGWDLDNPAAALTYSRELQQRESFKAAAEIEALQARFEFREVARRFAWISQDSIAVVVPFGDGLATLAALREAWTRGQSGRLLWRRLQRFCVQLPIFDDGEEGDRDRAIDKLVRSFSLEPVDRDRGLFVSLFYGAAGILEEPEIDDFIA